MTEKPRKDCPLCGEEILAVATRCKHCHATLAEQSTDFYNAETVMSSAEPSLDALFDNRYRIKRRLGSGGMGTVYLAVDEKLEVEVAIKSLPPLLFGNPGAMKALRNEAKLAINLSHPNICRVLHYDYNGETAYLIMEYIDGQSLAEVLAENGKQSEADSIKWLRGICSGLGYAHDHNVIHRDLKPGNVMRCKDSEIKICDFGIASTTRDTMSRLSGDTKSGSGTLSYMSPEQIRGKKLSASSDIYSLGCLLYELLSGKPPFVGGDLSYQHINEQPEKLDGLSKKLDSILMRCLAKDQKDRFSSVKELLTVLNRITRLTYRDLISHSTGIYPRMYPDKFPLIKMVRIPAGSFQMGSPSNESGRHDDEKQHEVTISKPFMMSKTEVTQKQWQAVMGNNPSEFDGNDNPVEQVNWYDCVEYCNKLSEKIGLEPVYKINGTNVTWNKNKKGYRLPTKAEWEYACRAGTTTRFSTGDSDSDLEKAGWFKDNSGGKTHPVAQKTPNSWGLYDMHGNVWEWCWDWQGDYSSSSAIDPRGSSTGIGRILRGGSGGENTRNCRSANRNRCNPEYRNDDLGFRLALDP